MPESIAVLAHLDLGPLPDPSFLAPMAVIQTAEMLRNLARSALPIDSVAYRERLWGRFTRLVREAVPEERDREGLLERLGDALSSDRVRRSMERISYLSVKEVARKLGVTSPTVRAWIASGALRVESFGQLGRRGIYRIARDELERFVREGRRGRSRSTPDPAAEAARVLAIVNGATTARRGE
jgi:excisionase family DNA binding protein